MPWLQQTLACEFDYVMSGLQVKQVRSVCPQLSNSEVEWALAEHDSRHAVVCLLSPWPQLFMPFEA